MISRGTTFFLACAYCMLFLLNAGQAEYTIRDLGALVGTDSKAEAISPAGHIGGESRNQNTAYLPTVWENGTLAMSSGGSLGGQTYGYSINDSLQLVGRGYDHTSRRKAFVWDPINNTQELPLLPGGLIEATAYGINNDGNIVGWSNNGSIQPRACLWAPDGAGGWTAIDLQPGDSPTRKSSGMDISEGGELIVGWRIAGDGYTQAWLWRWNEGTAAYDAFYMNVAGLTKHVYGVGCNESHQAVGYAYSASGALYEAVLWEDIDTMADHRMVTETYLGTLTGGSSAANAVNNAGQVVGWASGSSGNCAFIWDRTNGMQDLNDLVLRGAGWDLQEAKGINDDGHIVGIGVNPDGFTRGFLLVPVGPPDPQLEVKATTSRSIPVKDESITLGASFSNVIDFDRIEIDPGDPNSGKTVFVEFYVTPDGGAKIQVGSTIEVDPNAVRRVDVAWTPTQLGLHDIVCEVSMPSPQRQWTSPTLQLFAANQQLHFNYWDNQFDPLWATSLRDWSETTEGVQQWLDRGVVPLQWKRGNGDYHDNAADYADYFQNLSYGRTGYVVDEFLGGSGAEDEVMGQALSIVESETPEVYSAAYSIGLSGANMIAGFQAIDLGLVETYATDWRYYSIFNRYDEFVSNGAGDNSVCALGVNGTNTHHWVTNEKELRQQVAYVRTNWPDMAGIAVYGSPPFAPLADAIDDVIYNYYLGPAMLLTVDGLNLHVRNIGSLDATGVSVFVYDAGGAVQETISVGTVAAGATESRTAAGAFASAQIADSADYTVVTYVDPTTLPMPDAAAQAAAEAYRDSFLGGTDVKQPLTGRPALTVLYDGSKVTGGSIPLPSMSRMGEKSVAVSFDVHLDSSGIYPSNGVGIGQVGGSFLGFSWAHGDRDADLSSTTPRVTFQFTNQEGYVLTETFPPGLGAPGDDVTLTAVFDESGSVRAMMFDSSGGLLWDTGAHAIDGHFKADAIIFSVSSNAASTVAWDTNPGSDRVRLHGVNVSSMTSWVSNINISAPWIHAPTVLWTEGFEGYALSGPELVDQDDSWSEGFRNSPTSWYGKIQNAAASEGSQALELYAYTNSIGSPYCYYNVTKNLTSIPAMAANEGDYIVISVDVRAPVKESSEQYIRLFDTSGNQLTYFNWDYDFWVDAAYNGIHQTTDAYVHGSVSDWFTVVFEIDTDSDTFDLYVDGQFAVDDWLLAADIGPADLGGLMLETKFYSVQGTSQFDNIQVWLPTPEFCGDGNTFYQAADLSGPADEPDCIVDIIDLACMTSYWLDCTAPGDPTCN